MNDTQAPSDAIRASVDRLYWNSDGTVDELAARLGLKRTALYAAVRPHPAGALCAECGEEMVFANRTSRSARQARCPGCGASARVPAAAAQAAVVELAERTGPPAEAASARRRGWRVPAGGAGWAARLGGVAALGAVVAAGVLDAALRRA